MSQMSSQTLTWKGNQPSNERAWDLRDTGVGCCRGAIVIGYISSSVPFFGRANKRVGSSSVETFDISCGTKLYLDKAFPSLYCSVLTASVHQLSVLGRTDPTIDPILLVCIWCTCEGSSNVEQDSWKLKTVLQSYNKTRWKPVRLSLWNSWLLKIYTI